MKSDAIVLYPAPSIGHLVSMVELGKLILNRYSHKLGFSIIVFLTTGNLSDNETTSYIHHVSNTNPSITFRRFPFVSVDTSPTRSPAAIHFDFIRLNADNVLHAIREIPNVIRALVIDFFCASAIPIARELRHPVYFFFTSGAYALAFYLYFPTVHKQVDQSFKHLNKTFLQFPGFPPIRASHVPEPVLDRDDPAYADMVCFCDHLPKSDGIIVNTFDALEPMACEAIASGACVPDATTPPIYCIGPLIANTSEGGGENGNASLGRSSEREAKHEWLSWLDAQPKGSVVFLCFGSRGSFTRRQLKEMAHGLERSGQRFMWVLKSPPCDAAAPATEFCLEDVLPEGFLERTKKTGMVVRSWVPQVAVLNHGSVGGFVTHCGWNSVLEAVVAGVPMVAWPLYAEQHVNGAALVENMKMAIPLGQEKEEDDDGFVSAAELEKALRELMESEGGRERSLKMREMAMAAWENNGSSTTSLAKFVEWLEGS